MSRVERVDGRSMSLTGYDELNGAFIAQYEIRKEVSSVSNSHVT